MIASSVVVFVCFGLLRNVCCYMSLSGVSVFILGATSSHRPSLNQVVRAGTMAILGKTLTFGSNEGLFHYIGFYSLCLDVTKRPVRLRTC